MAWVSSRVWRCRSVTALVSIAILTVAPSSAGVARAQRTTRSTLAQAPTELCQRLSEDGSYEKAELACVQALNVDAGHVAAWKIYLPILISLHKEDKAIAEAERAETTLGINDATVLAFHGVAILQAASGPAVDPKTQQPNKWAKQYARALPFLERSVALNSEEYSALAALCTYWTLQHQYMDRSSAACQMALRKQPNNADLLNSLAWIYYNHKRYADAQTTAEQLLRVKGYKPQMEIKAKLVIGLSMADRGDCAGARRILEPMQKLANRGGWLIDRGLTLCAQTPQEADRYYFEYMRGIADDPKGPLAHALAYRNFAARKRPADAAQLGTALSDLVRAKQMANQKGMRDVVKEATRNRAEILSQLGQFAQAEEEWKPIYEEEGAGNADAVLGYGVASRKAGDFKVAQRVLEQGAKKNPDNAAIRFELGLSQAALGECAQARRTLESLRNVSGFSSMIDRGLAPCLPDGGAR